MRQASESEICNKYYDEQQLNKLISGLQENASKMLLFLQNVCKISVFQISSDQDPSLPNAVFRRWKRRHLETFSSISTPDDRIPSEENNNHVSLEADLNGSWVFEQQSPGIPYQFITNSVSFIPSLPQRFVDGFTKSIIERGMVDKFMLWQ